MANQNDRSQDDVHRADPRDAATDPNAAAQQDRMKADHDALEESSRRVAASVPSEVRDRPIEASNLDRRDDAGTAERVETRPAATDLDAAAQQDRIKADHDRMEASARRVEASVPAEVRDTPIGSGAGNTQASEDNSDASRNAENARKNADAAREADRRR